MPHPPKHFTRGDVLFVTTSVEQDLLFPPNDLINLIQLSCLARAQALYPVTIDTLTLCATHSHKILVVQNPEDVPRFIGYYKAETAHAINRLLGVKKRTRWCRGYDSPVLYEDPDQALEKIAYVHINPVKDDLVETLAEYPGVNSWECFVSGAKEHEIDCVWVPRSYIKQLPSPAPALRELNSIAAELTERAAANQQKLIITPGSAMQALGITDPSDQKRLRERLLRRVKDLELGAAQTRRKAGRSVIGAMRLKQTPIGSPYLPDRTGERSSVICGDVALRRRYLAALRDLQVKAKEVQQRWKQGDFSAPYPLGLFPPSMPRLANMIRSTGSSFAFLS